MPKIMLMTMTILKHKLLKLISVIISKLLHKSHLSFNPFNNKTLIQLSKKNLTQSSKIYSQISKSHSLITSNLKHRAYYKAILKMIVKSLALTICKKTSELKYIKKIRQVRIQYLTYLQRMISMKLKLKEKILMDYKRMVP